MVDGIYLYIYLFIFNGFYLDLLYPLVPILCLSTVDFNVLSNYLFRYFLLSLPCALLSLSFIELYLVILLPLHLPLIFQLFFNIQHPIPITWWPLCPRSLCVIDLEQSVTQRGLDIPGSSLGPWLSISKIPSSVVILGPKQSDAGERSNPRSLIYSNSDLFDYNLSLSLYYFYIPYSLTPCT